MKSPQQEPPQDGAKRHARECYDALRTAQWELALADHALNLATPEVLVMYETILLLEQEEHRARRALRVKLRSAFRARTHKTNVLCTAIYETFQAESRRRRRDIATLHARIGETLDLLVPRHEELFHASIVAVVRMLGVDPELARQVSLSTAEEEGRFDGEAP